jgi:hypothetical protein
MRLLSAAAERVSENSTALVTQPPAQDSQTTILLITVMN